MQGARKKQREVLFRFETMDHLQEKISAENKKLICKLTHPFSLNQSRLTCRHWCSLGLVRSVRRHGAELQKLVHEVRWGLRSHGVLLRRRRSDPWRNSLRIDLRSFDMQTSFLAFLWGREEGRNRWRRLHQPWAIHRTTHSKFRRLKRDDNTNFLFLQTNQQNFDKSVKDRHSLLLLVKWSRRLQQFQFPIHTPVFTFSNKEILIQIFIASDYYNNLIKFNQSKIQERRNSPKITHLHFH